jgi:hypothetical protein
VSTECSQETGTQHIAGRLTGYDSDAKPPLG